MTDTYSTVERLLRDHQPAPLSESIRAEHKRELLAMIAAEPLTAPATSEHRRRRLPWRRPGTWVLAGGLVLGSAGAVTAFVTRAQPDEVNMVRCFSVAAPPFTEGAPGTYDASYGEADSLAQSAARAIELCGYGWADGSLPWPETVGPTDNPPGGEHPVPPLQACVLPDGVVGVFPGDATTCAHLGLPESAA